MCCDLVRAPASSAGYLFLHCMVRQEALHTRPLCQVHLYYDRERVLMTAARDTHSQGGSRTSAFARMHPAEQSSNPSTPQYKSSPQPHPFHNTSGLISYRLWCGSPAHIRGILPLNMPPKPSLSSSSCIRGQPPGSKREPQLAFARLQSPGVRRPQIAPLRKCEARVCRLLLFLVAISIACWVCARRNTRTTH